MERTSEASRAAKMTTTNDRSILGRFRVGSAVEHSPDLRTMSGSMIFLEGLNADGAISGTSDATSPTDS